MTADEAMVEVRSSLLGQAGLPVLGMLAVLGIRTQLHAAREPDLGGLSRHVARERLLHTTHAFMYKSREVRHSIGCFDLAHEHSHKHM